jgi:hypothetical protein
MNPREFLEASGWVSLTESYIIPEQAEILENALRSLRRGGRLYFVLEEEDDTMEIFVPKRDLLPVD